mmetsp:Transcript_31685/g.102331  ORF Transcript_31685/g.102331 Transcript_31685/m.102331 type:complete len:202 (-) Transcript_31685:785-1390(-)
MHAGTERRADCSRMHCVLDGRASCLLAAPAACVAARVHSLGGGEATDGSSNRSRELGLVSVGTARLADAGVTGALLQRAGSSSAVASEAQDGSAGCTGDPVCGAEESVVSQCAVPDGVALACAKSGLPSTGGGITSSSARLGRHVVSTRVMAHLDESWSMRLAGSTWAGFSASEVDAWSFNFMVGSFNFMVGSAELLHSGA